LWGAIQCSSHPGIALADVLCHEYRHTLLNALLDADPLIDESSPKAALFYSPWRSDPRPLVSLLHAIYAFMEVVGFYDSYLDRFGQQAPQAALAEERIISNVHRLQIATREFEQHAKLTTFGREFFEGIQQRIETFARAAANFDSFYRDPIVTDIERHHVQWLVQQGRAK
jgi:HEXXH motif-containing protein